MVGSNKKATPWDGFGFAAKLFWLGSGHGYGRVIHASSGMAFVAHHDTKGLSVIL
jgi:hypothetical protein